MTGCADKLDPSIAVALLAAGRGERFTGDKLSADLDGRPLGRWAVDAAERAGFVTRSLIASPDNAGAFEGTSWNVVVNPRAAEGMGTSVACAAEAARDCSRLVLILADMPFVEPAHLRALALGEGVVFTRYPDGRNGIPTAFPASAFARLQALQGDRGASAQTWGDHATALAPASGDSLFDIDTAADLALAQARLPDEGLGARLAQRQFLVHVGRLARTAGSKGGMRMGRLSGITVVDLTQFLPGPMMTVMMADHGARVIKIEPLAGDPARDQGPFEAGHSVWFANCNRGKESRALDLKSDAGKAALAELCREADVFVEGFRPGVMARLGFDYEAVRALNPAIVYCSITAFGQDGALAQHPAHDMAVQALAGFLAVNDGPDGAPVVPGVASSDMAAGLTALSAVLMALLGRERSGEGAYIDCAMFDSLLPWCAHTAGSAIAGGESPRSASQRSLGGAGFYQVYRTADGRHVALGGREIKFAKVLLAALGREDLLPYAEAPAGEQEPLIAFLRETFAGKTRNEWVEWFADKDVAFAPVLDFREALDQPHIAERGLLVETEDGAHHIAPPIRFAGERWEPGAVPELPATAR